MWLFAGVNLICVMYLQRKLLYHRMIDDESGTYITDYVQCGVCLTCLAYLIHCELIAKCQSVSIRALTYNVTKTTYFTCLLLFAYSILTLFAGLAHQFLQTVHPYETWHDDMTWLIVWRMGLAFSSGFSLSLLVIPKFLLEQENVFRMSSKLSLIYYAVVGLLCIGVFTHSVWMIFDETDPWRALPVFMSIFMSAFINCVVAMFVFAVRTQRDMKSNRLMENSPNQQGCAESLVKPQTKERRPISRSVSTCTDDGAKSTHDEKNLRVRWDLLLRGIAPLVFVAGGFTWLGMTKMGCSDNDNPAANGCPLPNHFNHNALMHVMHSFAIFMFFAAELLAIRRRPNSCRSSLIECERQSTV
uniref:Uncharacterized protein LOC100183876 n=1 Tax=Phallusia mammillata TaxID=59560 RepID=A0A6F9DI60_9ASCI|nr:uncharacterized protein LOC100183876 [Phallusia mammillata]